MDFIDLKAQYQLLNPSLQKHILDILDRAQFIMGKEITELEEKLSLYTGASHCISCASGTDALFLALLARGVGPGDAIFTTTFTFIATAEVISLLGATPVFVDIDKKTYNIDPISLRHEIVRVNKGEKIAVGITNKIKPKGIIPVDLFGLCADYDSIDAIAKEFGLFVLEDAAQSFGAMYHGKKACALGDCAATSFFPAKPLGCYGDGGAVFCNDKAMKDILVSLRIHGQGIDKYENVRIGINGRMDTIQAAVLLAKLEIFDSELEKRQRVAQRYSDALAGTCTVPTIPQGYSSAWAQYSILHDHREAIIEKCKRKEIPTAIYYPKPLHLQKAFAPLGYEKGQFPVAENIAGNILSLPMHPYLTKDNQEKIIETILD
ncbi:MAG TPA: DegT/DnrJ/EryC1/StrS family aminotransferase [Chitinivibrionales bacterium]|nr:DegT/DnrJ/EryC1/StrS family aminotransferase [Chitinivibrionales bacterium]